MAKRRDLAFLGQLGHGKNSAMGTNEARSYRRTTCRLCLSSDLQTVLALAPTPPADDYVSFAEKDRPQETYPLDLALCNQCGHVFLLDIVNPEVLYANFVYKTSSSPGLPEHFASYADDLVRTAKPRPGSLVIDIGSNDGVLLRALGRHGLKVLGIDPARDIATKATESGIETLPEYFTPELARRIRKERGAVSIITANNVVANIDDMVALAEGISELLTPDGVFVFETLYLADVVEKGIFDNIYHEHLSYYTVLQLVPFFKRYGLALFDVEHVATKGGSLRVKVGRADAAWPIAGAVAKFTDEELKAELHLPSAFLALETRLARAREVLLDFIDTAHAQGKTVCGYGASHSVTTLIAHFQLGEKLAFLVDDNPVKQGRFSPGYHIPIYPPKALLERRPDFAVTLAWRFAEQMIERNAAYRTTGGQFVVPLPALRVL